MIIKIIIKIIFNLYYFCSGSKYPIYAVFSIIALLIHIPFSLVVVLNSFTADPNSTDPLRRYLFIFIFLFNFFIIL